MLELGKTVMYEFWYDYVKPKYEEKGKLCYMDLSNCIFHVRTDNIYKDIVEDVEARFDASSYELERPLSKGKNKKIIGLIKYELGIKSWMNLFD